MKLIKSLVFSVALVALALGALTIAAPSKAQASRCCWVMVCTQTPPIVCWEECVRCPGL